MNVQVKDKKETNKRLAAYQSGVKNLSQQKSQDHRESPASGGGKPSRDIE